MSTHYKVAVITGAGSGVGRSVALSLATKHYRLVLAGRRLKALHETASLLDSSAPEPLCVATDITREDEVARLFSKAVEHGGRLDLLFNNAGTNAPPISIEEIDSHYWHDVITTNLTGTFYCLRAAFRVMKAQTPQGGRIINNGSISAVSPRPNAAPYTASKHAITGLTKSAALDGRVYNIACCQIDIGNAASDMGSRTAEGAYQANGSLIKEPVMAVQHVGEAVSYMDSLPLEANVPFMTLMATHMPFIGRG